jgi:hypothetical protein
MNQHHVLCKLCGERHRLGFCPDLPPDFPSGLAPPDVMVRTDGPQTVGTTASVRDDGEPRQNAGGPVPSLQGRPQKFKRNNVVRDILYVTTKFDKRTYQRELMRKRRAEGKAK